MLFTPDSIKIEFGGSENTLKMGDIGNILNAWILRCKVARRLAARLPAAIVVGALVLWMATAAHAGSIRLTATERLSEPVSTSPLAKVEVRPDPSALDTSSATEGALPLTRAAAKKRVEDISPLEWLEHYGRVAVRRTQ